MAKQQGACHIIYLCDLCKHYHNCAGTQGHNDLCFSGSGPEHDRQPLAFFNHSSSAIYRKMEELGWK